MDAQGKQPKYKGRMRRVLIPLICLALLSATIGILFWQGVIILNHPDRQRYPIRGVDVSAWQGDIEWATLSTQDIQFAYLKATEGATWKDQQFAANWTNARSASLAVGAYHFLSFDTDGPSQAQNFTETVPNAEDALPCAVDVELYGSYQSDPPDKEQVDNILKPLLDLLEQHYGKKPVLYCTQRSYNLYIKEGYAGYPLWIRNVFSSPSVSQDHPWTFWQYTDRGRLSGYQGKEKFIDLNVFHGTRDEFTAFTQK